MTYCLQHITKKMLIMPVEPYEPNKSCYVCSETPLSLEINTHLSTLREFVEKIVKAKLGMNFPLIMHGSNLLYEVGDDLDKDEVANYAANLEKVLAELPSPVNSGTMLTVEDLQQELTRNINIKHREEFNEEKEPDGMVLSGWTQVPPAKKHDKQSVGNGRDSSNALQTEPVDAGKDSEIEEISEPSGKKRKLSEASKASILDAPNATDGTRNQMEVEKLDEDEEDDIVMFDDLDSMTNKKKKLR